MFIAHRLPFKVWRINKENNIKYIENKTRIQNEFKIRTGLIIDQVKTGYGTTNDGNTARRFFMKVFNRKFWNNIKGIIIWYSN